MASAPDPKGGRSDEPVHHAAAGAVAHEPGLRTVELLCERLGELGLPIGPDTAREILRAVLAAGGAADGGPTSARRCRPRSRPSAWRPRRRSACSRPWTPVQTRPKARAVPPKPVLDPAPRRQAQPPTPRPNPARRPAARRPSDGEGGDDLAGRSARSSGAREDTEVRRRRARRGTRRGRLELRTRASSSP